ncbi:phenylacetate--CoA ligase family protein [Agrobacterium cavarae]|uniref:phenylacetate--CoA ligase family protein n=1 Tax=Agrobacterium cavarae TaxID=2528239 RepID=UPI00289D43FE|nr:AMP-binding protein [Agrobacterium cavarae]
MGYPFPFQHSDLHGRCADELLQFRNTTNVDLRREITDKWLSSAWDRASRSEHYRHIGNFTKHKFDSITPVNKRTFKESYSAFDAADAASIIKYYETSGTTGVPTPTKRTFEDIVWNYVGVSLLWGEVVDRSDRSIVMLPSDIAPIGDLIAGCCEIIGSVAVRCYPFTQGIVSWGRMEVLFQNFRPTVIWCAPGTLLQFTRVLRQRKSFDDIASSVVKIMLSGEVVTESLKRSLGHWWQAEVYNASYGSTETGTIAAAGRNGQLNVLEYSFLCELRNDAGEVSPLEEGARGELIISSLHGFARPMLRIATGDTVSIKAPESGLHSLEVLGRKEEAILIRDVPYLAGDIENHIYKIPDVTGYLLDVAEGSVTRVIVEQMPDGSSTDHIMQHATRILGDAGIDVRVEVVSQLPITTKSGAGLKNWKRSNILEARK